MNNFPIALLLISTLACQSAMKVEDKASDLTRLDALVYYYSKTEGELAYTAADLLHEELFFNPLDWYQAMNHDTLSFNRFLKDLRNKVFVDHGSLTIQELEEQRRQLLSRLKVIEIPPEYVELSEMLIRELEDIRPREIQ